MTSGREAAGEVREVLGPDVEDIFHALRVCLPSDVAAAYHLASVGWLRGHLGWRRDSRGHEEPG